MAYEITDKTVYRSTVWTIEGDNDTYHVTCQEGELTSTWYIVGDKAGEVDNDIELGYELISMCEFDDTIDI